jgi:predicted DNA-binding transcriptional regulator AlpA
MTSIENLIKENPGINLTVNAGQLMEFGESIADRAVKTFLQKNDEKVYSRKEVAEKFGICETSLWRYTKMGLIESKKIGARVFYPESEIKRMMSHKGGEK